MLVGAAFYLLLHSVKLSQRDDWFVAVRYVVLGQLPVILQCAFGEMVFSVGLLKDQIARVGIIPQHSSAEVLARRFTR